MQNLATQLNESQLKQNIDALIKQNAPREVVQSYVDNYQKSADGNYVLKTSQTPTQPEQSLLEKTGGVIGDVATGIGKGATSTAIGLGQVALKGASLIPGLKNTAEQAIQTGEDIKNTQLQADNTAQAIGKGGEQIAEMFIPVGGGLKIAGKLSKMPKIIQGLTKTGIKAVESGAEFAGKTYLQTGGDTKEATKAGVIAGSITPLAIGAGKLLEKIPETAWSAILKRVPTSVEKNPLLEKQIAKEGVIGLSKKQLSQKFGREIQNLEMAIADTLENKTGQISTEAVANRLTQLRTKYANIPGEEVSVAKIDEIMQGLLKKGKQTEVSSITDGLQSRIKGKITPTNITNQTKIEELKMQTGQLDEIINNDPLKGLSSHESKQFPGTLSEDVQKYGDKWMDSANISNTENSVNDIANQYEKWAKGRDNLKALKNELKQVKSESFKDYTPEQLSEINSRLQEATSTINDIRTPGGNLSLQEANQLKRDIYGLISNSYGKGLLEVPAKTEAQKMVALGLKQELEKAVPELKSLNNKQAVFIQTKKAIDKTIARQTGKGIAGTGVGLFDILLGIGGTSFAGPQGLALVGAKKVAESSGFLSTSSAISQKILDYFSGLSPTQKVLFYNGLTGLTIQSSKSKK
jgi:hypothetical protein